MAVITHPHPLGVEGAKVIALSAAWLLQDASSVQIVEKLRSFAESSEFTQKLTIAGEWLTSGIEASAKDVAKTFGNGIRASDSCVTAVYLALRFREKSFEKLLNFAIKLGGDVDTIAAMAGGMWGAANELSVLPANFLSRIEQNERLVALAKQFAEPIDKLE